jgi:hypothetical protein
MKIKAKDLKEMIREIVKEQFSMDQFENELDKEEMSFGLDFDSKYGEEDLSLFDDEDDDEDLDESVKKLCESKAPRAVHLNMSDKVDMNVKATKIPREEWAAKITPSIYDWAEKKFGKAATSITRLEPAMKQQAIDIHTTKRAITIAPFVDYLAVHTEDNDGRTEVKYFKAETGPGLKENLTHISLDIRQEQLNEIETTLKKITKAYEDIKDFYGKADFSDIAIYDFKSFEKNIDLLKKEMFRLSKKLDLLDGDRIRKNYFGIDS